MAISIHKQPSTTGISSSRSPIIYKYDGADINWNYVFSFYVSTTTSFSVIPTVEISRRTDIYGSILVDVSNIIKNYLIDNLQYSTDNLLSIKAVLTGYDTAGTLGSTTTSDVGIASLGYTQYAQGGVAEFNLTETGEYLLNSLVENTPYYIPNYGTENSLSLKWRYLSQSTGFKIVYTNSASTISTYNSTWTPGTDLVSNNIKEILIGYGDLTSIYGLSVNVDLPFTVSIMNNSTVIKSYIFYPDKCNGNDLTNVAFINRFGVWDDFFFYGRRNDDLTITNEIYKYNKVDYVAMTYNISSGSYHKLLSQGRKGVVLNTGWIDENKNNVFEELLLSEVVLIGVNPYVITDKEIKYKSNKWDKLINYTLTMQLGYDTINNIL